MRFVFRRAPNFGSYFTELDKVRRCPCQPTICFWIGINVWRCTSTTFFCFGLVTPAGLSGREQCEREKTPQIPRLSIDLSLLHREPPPSLLLSRPQCRQRYQCCPYPTQRATLAFSPWNFCPSELKEPRLANRIHAHAEVAARLDRGDVAGPGRSPTSTYTSHGGKVWV